MTSPAPAALALPALPAPTRLLAPSPMHHAGQGVGHVIAMAVVVCAAAPAAVWLARRTGKGTPLDRTPSLMALLAFVVVHDVTMAWMVSRNPSSVTDVAAHVLLGLGAVQFWAPVIGGRLRPAAKVVYLFGASMGLDFTAIYLIAIGYSLAGVSMVMLMLPVPFAGAYVLTRWAVTEERAQREIELRAVVAHSSGVSSPADDAPRSSPSSPGLAGMLPMATDPAVATAADEMAVAQPSGPKGVQPKN